MKLQINCISIGKMTNTDSKNAQIFVMCHKPVDYNIPANTLYTPIQCGAAISDKDICDLKDNTGDNISSLNPFYLETTATYWIWKNRSESKYVGQCQYRRQIIFDEDTDFDEIFKNHDFVVAYPINFPCSVKTQYVISHIDYDLNMVGDIIRDKYPEYSAGWEMCMNNKYLYYSAGFIMKSHDYDKYCELLFGVLSEFRKRFNLQTIDDVKQHVINAINNGKLNGIKGKDIDYQMRIGGYLAERIFTAFALSNFNKPYFVKYKKYENV